MPTDEGFDDHHVEDFALGPIEKFVKWNRFPFKLTANLLILILLCTFTVYYYTPAEGSVANERKQITDAFLTIYGSEDDTAAEAKWRGDYVMKPQRRLREWRTIRNSVLGAVDRFCQQYRRVEVNVSKPSSVWEVEFAPAGGMLRKFLEGPSSLRFLALTSVSNEDISSSSVDVDGAALCKAQTKLDEFFDEEMRRNMFVLSLLGMVLPVDVIPASQRIFLSLPAIEEIGEIQQKYGRDLSRLRCDEPRQADPNLTIALDSGLTLYRGPPCIPLSMWTRATSHFQSDFNALVRYFAAESYAMTAIQQLASLSVTFQFADDKAVFRSLFQQRAAVEQIADREWSVALRWDWGREPRMECTASCVVSATWRWQSFFSEDHNNVESGLLAVSLLLAVAAIVAVDIVLRVRALRKARLESSREEREPVLRAADTDSIELEGRPPPPPPAAFARSPWVAFLLKGKGEKWHLTAMVSHATFAVFISLHLCERGGVAASESLHTATTFALASCCFLYCVGLLAFLRFTPRSYMLIRATRRAAGRLGLLVIGVSPIFFGFACLFHFSFGSTGNGEFGSMHSTLVALVFMMYGDNLLPAFRTMDEQQLWWMTVLADIAGCAYVAMFMSVTLNLAVAVVVDTYHDVCHQNEVLLLVEDDASPDAESVRRAYVSQLRQQIEESAALLEKLGFPYDGKSLSSGREHPLT